MSSKSLLILTVAGWTLRAKQIIKKCRARLQPCDEETLYKNRRKAKALPYGTSNITIKTGGKA